MQTEHGSHLVKSHLNLEIFRWKSDFVIFLWGNRKWSIGCSHGFWIFSAFPYLKCFGFDDILALPVICYINQFYISILVAENYRIVKFMSHVKMTWRMMTNDIRLVHNLIHIYWYLRNVWYLVWLTYSNYKITTIKTKRIVLCIIYNNIYLIE